MKRRFGNASRSAARAIASGDARRQSVDFPRLLMSQFWQNLQAQVAARRAKRKAPACRGGNDSAASFRQGSMHTASNPVGRQHDLVILDARTKQNPPGLRSLQRRGHTSHDPPVVQAVQYLPGPRSKFVEQSRAPSRPVPLLFRSFPRWGHGAYAQPVRGRMPPAAFEKSFADRKTGRHRSRAWRLRIVEMPIFSPPS